MLESKFLIFTVEGLNELTKLYKNRKDNYFRNKKVPLIDQKANPLADFNFTFDPEASLKIHTPVLRGSLHALIDHAKNPESLPRKITKKYQKLAEEKERIKQEKKRKELEEMYDDQSLFLKRKEAMKKEKRKLALKNMRKLKLQRRAK